mgnify:CR=1 FL=1
MKAKLIVIAAAVTNAIRLTDNSDVADITPDMDQYLDSLKGKENDQWISELSQHVSVEGAKKTEYAVQKEQEAKSGDKQSYNWMERLDMLDPNLGQDITSEYMNVQKTSAAIKRLEKKVEMESHGFEFVEQYE